MGSPGRNFVAMKMFLATLAAALCLAGGLVVASPTPALAANGDCESSSSGFLGFPTWYKYVEKEPAKVAGKCTLKFNFPADFAKIALAVVEIMLRFGGLIAVGYIIYGGVQFVLSQGDLGQGNVPKTTIARHTVQNALIGLVVAMLATAIVRLVGNTLIN